MLLFKKKFLDPIRRGEKTQTIRLWKRQLLQPGQRSYTPGIGPIQIVAVEPVELGSLTDADAALDGFANVEALRSELREIYGEKLLAGHTAYRVTFAVGHSTSELASSAPSQRPATR